MVVHDLDLGSVAVLPDETLTETVVDADAVLPGPVFLECLKVEARAFEIVQRGGRVQDSQLPVRGLAIASSRRVRRPLKILSASASLKLLILLLSYSDMRYGIKAQNRTTRATCPREHFGRFSGRPGLSLTTSSKPEIRHSEPVPWASADPPLSSVSGSRISCIGVLVRAS